METTNNKTERADGYYHINHALHEWSIAKWQFKEWTIDGGFVDKIIEVDERPIVREPEKVKEAIPYSHFQYHLMTLRNNLYNALPTGDSSLFEFIKVIKSHIEEIDRLLKNGVVGEPLVKGWIFPKANEEQQIGGWTFSVGFMEKIVEYVNENNEDISLEAIDLILKHLESLPLDTDTKTKE